MSPRGACLEGFAPLGQSNFPSGGGGWRCGQMYLWLARGQRYCLVWWVGQWVGSWTGLQVASVEVASGQEATQKGTCLLVPGAWPGVWPGVWPASGVPGLTGAPAGAYAWLPAAPGMG